MATEQTQLPATVKPPTAGARKAAHITAAVTEVVLESTLKLHPMNARAGNVTDVKESLMFHGQARPLVANRRTKHVLAGNHTLMALRELGVQNVLVSWVDVDEKTEKKFLLIENKTNDPKGNHEKYHLDKLELLLEEVGIAGTGYGEVEHADIVEQMEMTRSDGGKKLQVNFKGGYAETEEEFKTRTSTVPGVQLRELVLLYEDIERVNVLNLIERLNKQWKLKGGNPAVVSKALRLCAGMFQPDVSEEQQPVVAEPVNADTVAAVATPTEDPADVGHLG